MAFAAPIDRRAAETLIGLSIPMDGSWLQMGGEAALERILVSFTACSVRVTACAGFMLAPKPDVLIPGAGAQDNHLKSATTRVSNTNTLQDIQVLPISDPKFAGHWLPRLRWASPFLCTFLLRFLVSAMLPYLRKHPPGRQGIVLESFLRLGVAFMVLP